MQKKEVQEVPLDLIDEPVNAERSQLVMEKLEALADSIREIGVVNPIRLNLRGNRFEIESGHRRFLAARMAKLATVPCIVLGAGDVDQDVARFHENFFREDVNPVDEGRWFLRLAETKKWAVKDIARFCSRSSGYVTSRMNLVQGDARVLAALEAGQVNFSQGVEILRASDEGVRSELLRVAVENGATVSSQQLMRFDYERVNRSASSVAVPGGAPPGTYAEQKHLISCPACHGEYDVRYIYPLSVCKTCYDGLLAGFREAEGRRGG